MKGWAWFSAVVALVLLLFLSSSFAQTCQMAVTLETISQDATIESKNGKTIQGPIHISNTTTTDVDPDTGFNKWAWCGDETRDHFKGRWFTFSGTGGLMTLSTCSSATDVTHDISVKTTCDGTDSCVTNNKNRKRKSQDVTACTDTAFAKEFSLLTEANQVYYAFVKAKKPKKPGSFGISLTDNQISARRINRCLKKAKKHCKCSMRYRPCIQQVVRENCRFSHTHAVWHRERRIAQIKIYRNFEIMCSQRRN